MPTVVSLFGILTGSVAFAVGIWQQMAWLIGVGLVVLAVAVVVGLVVPPPKSSDEGKEMAEGQQAQRT